MRATHARHRGVTFVEWMTILAIAVALGLVTVRIVMSHLEKAGDHAGNCIVAAVEGGGDCNGNGGGTPGGAETNTGPSVGFNAAELTQKIENVATSGNSFNPNRLVAGLIGKAGNALDDAASWGIDNFGPYLGYLPGMQFLQTEVGRSFEKGMVDGAIGLVSGVLQTVADPVGAGEGIGRLAVAAWNHPSETASGIWSQITDSWNKDPARFIGNAAFQVGSLFIPGADAGEAVKVVDGVAELGRATTVASDVGRTTEVIEDIARAPKPSTSTALVPYWPPNNGFLGTPAPKLLEPGTIIDRYGGSDYSRFFSPAGTPAAARALPAQSLDQPLRTFEVIKPFTVDAGTVAPAFAQLGLGEQYYTPVRLKELLERGIIREVRR